MACPHNAHACRVSEPVALPALLKHTTSFRLKGSQQGAPCFVLLVREARMNAGPSGFSELRASRASPRQEDAEQRAHPSGRASSVPG